MRVITTAPPETHKQSHSAFDGVISVEGSWPAARSYFFVWSVSLWRFLFLSKRNSVPFRAAKGLEGRDERYTRELWQMERTSEVHYIKSRCGAVWLQLVSDTFKLFTQAAREESLLPDSWLKGFHAWQQFVRQSVPQYMPCVFKARVSFVKRLSGSSLLFTLYSLQLTRGKWQEESHRLPLSSPLKG